MEPSCVKAHVPANPQGESQGSAVDSLSPSAEIEGYQLFML